MERIHLTVKGVQGVPGKTCFNNRSTSFSEDDAVLDAK
jgi:hypothetical protein